MWVYRPHARQKMFEFNNGLLHYLREGMF
jgi:hypothetical protein